MQTANSKIYNLPTPSTKFIGRKQDLHNIIDKLYDKDCHLLTCIGSGGIGKTRLVIEAVQHVNTHYFPHGIFYISLAPLKSSENLIPAIIDILGIHTDGKESPHHALLDFLCQRELLLVMDNFEHLFESLDIVTDIIQKAPNVTILTTSRKPLGLQAEHLWKMRGLNYPNIKDPEDINQFDAVNLFIERALQVQRDFSPSVEQHYLIEICQLVEGYPLAIELAASWLKTLSCTDIIQQIKYSIDILSTNAPDIEARHRSIRAVFDHSWHLLTVQEQAVFPHLSVFRDGFTLDAAMNVAGATIMSLSGLVEKSMIRRIDNSRYDIHELLRQYAEEKLATLNLSEHTNQQHLSYFTQLLVDAVPNLQGKQQVKQVNMIRNDFDNILGAWEYATQHLLIDKLDAMLEGLHIYFEIIRQPPISSDMYHMSMSALDKHPTDHIAFRIRLQIYSWYIVFRRRSNNFFESFPAHLDEYTDHVCRTGDNLSLLMCKIISNLTPPHAFTRTPDIDEILDISKHLEPYYQGWALNQICYYYTILLNDNSTISLKYLHDYLHITQSINDIDGIATAYSHLAQHARFWGDIDDAIDYYSQALVGFRQVNNIQATAVFHNLKIFMGLKKGKFAYVMNQLPSGVDKLTAFGFFSNHRFMHMILAKAEILSGHGKQGRHYLNKLATLPYDPRPRTIFHTYEATAMYAIAMNDITTLRHELTQALKLNMNVIAVRLLLDFLILSVFLYYHDKQYIRAIEITSLVFNHKLATTEWMKQWALLTDMLDKLEDCCDTRQFESAWQNGKNLNVDTTIAQLRYYLTHHETGIVHTPSLIEPLTDRELDILQLVGKGYTNKEIAETLIIALGTVKSHIHHIYSKFDVKNRTTAIRKAQQLGLLPE